MNHIFIQKVEISGLGTLVLGDFQGRLCLCYFEKSPLITQVQNKIGQPLKAQFTEAETPLIRKAIEQLNEYVLRKRKFFELPMLLVGTSFQKRCWEQLQKIPFGHTVSYAEEASILGKPKAYRAVAGANRVNPIQIIIPCHRVVEKNGGLGGYSAGVEIKKRLLELEFQK